MTVGGSCEAVGPAHPDLGNSWCRRYADGADRLGLVGDGDAGRKVQCADPACSVFLAEPWQAGQLILLVGFILFNMIGIGATLAIVLWFLNKQVATVRAQPSADTQNTASIEKA